MDPELKYGGGGVNKKNYVLRIEVLSSLMITNDLKEIVNKKKYVLRMGIFSSLMVANDLKEIVCFVKSSIDFAVQLYYYHTILNLFKSCRLVFRVL